jgi:hypothetical protein
MASVAVTSIASAARIRRYGALYQNGFRELFRQVIQEDADRWQQVLPAVTAVGKGLDAYIAVDASGTVSETKRQAGLLRMLGTGVILSDYATLMVEILKDNARPEAGAVYGALDMPRAKLVGQIAQAHGK